MPDDMAAAAAVVVPQTLVSTVGMVAYVRLVPRLATAPEAARQVFLPSPLKSLAVFLGGRNGPPQVAMITVEVRRSESGIYCGTTLAGRQVAEV
ncbi:hypothetical protein ACFUNF_19405 [Streptomyces sp. NPDC057291]|uniref:hypothetical protein n=1 Tax=Streptomyces sp. NPDC057291 TaxID=3346087 RepID=UPI00362B11BB